MADNLPFDIQVKIMERLPVKSLIHYRSLSKQWKSLIDSSEFIAGYRGQQQHLLVKYHDSEAKCVSIVDDDTFPQQKVSVPIPQLVKKLINCIANGSSHGLIFLYGEYINQKVRDGPISATSTAVIWNPAIRKAVAVTVPNVADWVIYGTAIGFGVCRETIDPKIVKITYIRSEKDIGSISFIPWQVEVFTLSTGAWRSPYSSSLPRKSIGFDRRQVVIGGFSYWLAYDSITIVGGSPSFNLIISFDMTSEEFREINLPHGLLHKCSHDLYLSELRDSLVVVEQVRLENKNVFHVWETVDGVPKSFKKLFTFDAKILGASLGAFVKGFKKTGEPIVQILLRDCNRSLAVYEPYSKSINNLVIDGRVFPHFVYSYMDTFLLL